MSPDENTAPVNPVETPIPTPPETAAPTADEAPVPAEDGAEATAEAEPAAVVPVTAPAEDAAEGAEEATPGTPGPSPLEQELARREEICVQAEQVAAEQNWRQGPVDLRKLADEWRSLRRWHDPREDRLQKRFDAARDAFYTAREAARTEARTTKERIAAQAEEIAGSDKWKATGDRFAALMDEWKAAGSAGHEADEQLWKRFNTARRSFFSARDAHFRELSAARGEARARKEKLIEEAKALAVTSADWTGAQWREASAKMKELMERWRKAGVAERADNDRLWKEFNEARKPFFDAQHEHYEALEAAQKAAAEAKTRLIEEARKLAEGGDFSREATERAKELDRKWKEIGFAGREANDRLWEEFRTAKEGFWDARRTWSEQRHVEWRQRSLDAIERRERRIANLKNQVERLQERVNNAYVTDHVEDMERGIEDREETIASLEAEVADIKARLSEE